MLPIIGNFGRPLKPFLSDKVKSKEPIILVNNDNIESNEIEVAKTFIEVFSNIVKNLEILEYRYHPSINIIRRYSHRFPSFYFSVVHKNTVLNPLNTSVALI